MNSISRTRQLQHRNKNKRRLKTGVDLSSKPRTQTKRPNAPPLKMVIRLRIPPYLATMALLHLNQVQDAELAYLLHRIKDLSFLGLERHYSLN